jgi:hypothetical protein
MGDAGHAGPAGGGKSDFFIGTCARDAVAFVYYARVELGQGRVPAPRTDVFRVGVFGEPGLRGRRERDLGREQEGDWPTACTSAVKGPKADFQCEVFFARDAARTPLSHPRSAAAMGSFRWTWRDDECGWHSFRRCRRSAAGSPIIPKRCSNRCGIWPRSRFSRGRAAVRPGGLRYRALPDGQQRLPRIRVRGGAAPPRRGGDARIQPASPDDGTHHPARRLGRLRARVRIRGRLRRAPSPSACASSKWGRITKALP